jgi:hypothetical protein
MVDALVAGGGGPDRAWRLHSTGPDERESGRHRVAEPKPVYRRPLFLSLFAVAAIAVIGVMTVSRADSPPAPTSKSTALRPAPREADDWVRANLPSNSRLLTDGVATPPGYPTSSLSEARDWHAFDYLLTTQTGTPSPNALVAPVWPLSTPVAIFDGLQVRHIASGATGQPPLDSTAELTKRVEAGEALLQNPHLQVSEAARPVLENGGLDLRAAAVLSGLSSQVHLALHDLTPVPFEAAAGTPMRAITVYTADTAWAIRNIDAFDPALRPEIVVVGEYGSIGLRWPLDFSPIPSVN